MTATTRSRPAIDPRLRERRVAVIRAQGRRRLRVVLALFIVVVLLGGAWVLLYSPALDVDRMVVDGARGDRAAEVVAASGIDVGDPVLFADLGGAARAIEELTWVDDARVARDLPASISIIVTRRTVVAWVTAPQDGNGGVALVDATGRVLEIVATAPAGVPELAGVTAVPDPGHPVEPAAGAEVLGELPAELRALTAAVRVEGSAATLVLADGVEVRLGDPTDLATKGRVALAVLQSLNEPVTYVDVQVPAVPVTG